MRRYGLDVRHATKALYGFGEQGQTVRPREATGNLEDLRSDNAPADVSWATTTNTTATPSANDLKKTGGTDGVFDAWGASATYSGGFSGQLMTKSGYLQFIVAQNDKDLYVGLTSDNGTPYADEGQLDAAIRCFSDGTAYAYIEGVSWGSVSYAASDEFRIEVDLDNDIVVFKKNGTAFVTRDPAFLPSAFASGGAAVAAWFSHSDGQITDVVLKEDRVVLGPVVSSERGYARSLDDGLGGIADEAVADSLQLHQNCTIRAVFKFAIDQASNGEYSTVIRRGVGGSDPERILWGLDVKRVSASSISLWWRWDHFDGVGYEEQGAANGIESGAIAYGGDEIVVVAVREWIAQDSVNVRFYVDGQLVATQTGFDGFIREGSGGTVMVGARKLTDGTYDQHWPTGSYLAELAVESDAMSTEEVRQEFRRLTVHQPAGRDLLRANLPPGTTYDPAPDSYIQLAIDADGDALGNVIALAEQLRDDWLPDQAYDPHLAWWEELKQLQPKPNATVTERRNAVLAAMRRVLGASKGDVKEALEPLLDVDASDLELVELTGLRTDDFSVDDITTPPSSMWVTHAGNGAVAISGGALNLSIGGTTDARWYAIGGPGPRREVSLSARRGEDVEGATILCQLKSNAFLADAVYGLYFRDIRGNAVIVGKEYNAIDGYEHIVAYEVDADAGTKTQLFDIDPGGSVDPQYLLIRYDEAGQIYYEYAATAAGIDGYSGATVAVSLSSPRWAGVTILGDVSTSIAADVDVTDWRVFEPKTPRGFVGIVYRDPADPGTPQIDAAQLQMDKQGLAHVLIQVATHKTGLLAGTGRAGRDPTMPTLT